MKRKHKQILEDFIIFIFFLIFYIGMPLSISSLIYKITPNINILGEGTIKRIQYITEERQSFPNSIETDYIVVFWENGDFTKLSIIDAKDLKLKEGISGRLYRKKSKSIFEDYKLLFERRT